jgi:Flp pilus assembly pilin Flp
MSVVNRLSRYVSCVLCVFCSIAVADTAVDHNTTRSNRDGAIDGGGSDVTLDSEIAQRGSGTVKFFNNSKGFGFTAGDQEGHNDSDAIEYGLIAALMSDGDSDAIEYGLIAALMSDVTLDQSAGDGDKFVRKRPGRFAQDQSAGDGDKFVRKRPGRFAQDQSAGDGDKFVRKRPGRFAQDVGLGGGAGNNGSGTLRNNDPIPGIDIIVEKDPEDNPALDNSPVMMLNEMLNAGYSHAEVVEFALATGLIGR